MIRLRPDLCRDMLRDLTDDGCVGEDYDYLLTDSDHLVFWCSLSPVSDPDAELSLSIRASRDDVAWTLRTAREHADDLVDYLGECSVDSDGARMVMPTQEYAFLDVQFRRVEEEEGSDGDDDPYPPQVAWLGECY